MAKDKYQVTVSGWFKLLATIVFIIFSVTSVFPKSDVAGISLLVYSFLFVFLAVKGSNSRAAAWIAERNLFSYIFFMPTIICAFYSAAIYFGGDADSELGAFSILLTILSIPLAIILLRFQGGIRRWNAFLAFLALPLSLYLFCRLFRDLAIAAAGGAAVVVFLVFLGCAVVQSMIDHRADDASGSDKADYRGYSARWDGKPDSDVSDKVIHLRGTIIVEYTGEFYQSNADSAVEDLIKTYVRRVAHTMRGYSVDRASLNIKYVNVG